MPRQLLLEGPAIEPLLRQVRAEHGESAHVLKAERVRVGGVGGFFAKERYEVTFEVDDAPPGRVAAAPPTSVFGSSVPASASAGRTVSGPGAPRGLAALLAAAEEAERASSATPAPPEPSPSAAALEAVHEALASRAAASSPAAAARPAFTDVLASMRGDQGGGRLAAPDDASPPAGGPTGAADESAGDGPGGDGAPGEALGEALGEARDGDPDQASAIEQLRRALDALGIVDDTDDTDDPVETPVDGPVQTPPAVPDEVPDEVVAEVPDEVVTDEVTDEVVAEVVDEEEAAPEPVGADGSGSHRSGPAPEDADDAATDQSLADALLSLERRHEDLPTLEQALAMLQELPAELAHRGGEAATATAGPPLTRREVRRAEEAARAQQEADEVPDEVEVVEQDTADLTAPAVGEASVSDEPDEPGEAAAVEQGRPDEEPRTDVFPAVALVLPKTLHDLGEPDPSEPLPGLPSVPLDASARSAAEEPRAVVAESAAALGPERDPDPDPAPDREPDPAPPPAPDPSPTATEAARPSSDALDARLARLGVHRRWLDGLPRDQAPALRLLAERLSVLDAYPRRAPRASDNPVVAVLAEGTGTGLETARTLALSLGLRADQVVSLAVEDHRTARPGASPVDRGAAARAAHAGRRHSQPVVVLVPVPFTPTPGERAAAAAALAALAADQVWAVVDATRRTADVERWLRTVGPPAGVDAVAVTGLAATSAPAESLELSAPVVLLDGQPATAVDWVATLAAQLTREDVQAHLDGLSVPILEGGA